MRNPFAIGAFLPRRTIDNRVTIVKLCHPKFLRRLGYFAASYDPSQPIQRSDLPAQQTASRRHSNPNTSAQTLQPN
ncbi:hypothetical protein RSSM_04581 [Rhodopirellula sallentina SM41]|uniref:Uncharacterized protein n=1 Tax=Rhodopirellula sallentina SM41 TaxID=1263870 RepID=M5TXM3_9BACT|nr:hypothetical protein RSSM_04581 [Rhodopirellula sallentina SM41]